MKKTDDNVQAEVLVKQVGDIIYIGRSADSNVKWKLTTVRANIQTAQTIYAIQGENGSKGGSTLYYKGAGIVNPSSSFSERASAVHVN